MSIKHTAFVGAALVLALTSLGCMYHRGGVMTGPAAAQLAGSGFAAGMDGGFIQADEAPAGRDQFAGVRDNAFVPTHVPGGDASTFAIDVDTASYATTRAWIGSGVLPPRDAIRIEEFINYFDYSYATPAPDAEHPLLPQVQIAECPWNPAHRLARISVTTRAIDIADRPASNLVFLVDVSGSMRPENKLPLLREAFADLVDQLDERDSISLVVYAGAAGVVLEPTAGDQRQLIKQAIRRLESGGSTAGAAGITLAYEMARKAFIPGGNNRVILATDGDFNVGVSDTTDLLKLVRRGADAGIDLTVIGVGQGNLQDGRIERLTNEGNGTYHYLDDQREARKVFGRDLVANLITLARDVKIQVFFNPAQVASWRQIGYANRQLRREDFDDDTKDAGEIGCGHSVTALYELIPAGAAPAVVTSTNPFIEAPALPQLANNDATLQVRVRYQPPGAGTSRLIEQFARDEGLTFDEADHDFHWVAAVAAWGLLLRDSPHLNGFSWDGLMELVQSQQGHDPDGERREACDLMRRSRQMQPHLHVREPVADVQQPNNTF